MTFRHKNVDLHTNSLSASNLRRLKWSVTIAILGFPIVVQLLGAMMLFASKYPVLSSKPVITFLGVLGLMVICAGIYAFLNRVSLRFSGLNTGLKEWELKTQKDAFAFSYKAIKLGMLCLFACISIFGAAQALGFFGSIVKLDLSAFAALTVILTYVVLFLPVLYIAWTTKPLTEDTL